MEPRGRTHPTDRLHRHSQRVRSTHRRSLGPIDLAQLTLQLATELLRLRSFQPAGAGKRLLGVKPERLSANDYGGRYQHAFPGHCPAIDINASIDSPTAVTLTTDDQRIRLAIGWNERATQGLDAYDRVVPPTSPMADQADVYLLRPDSGLRLQTDIQPHPDSARWHLVTTREIDLMVETTQLPVGYKLSVQGEILTGEQQIS